MPDQFECVRCGHVSIITAQPPKCPKCGSGTGIVTSKPADSGSDAPPAVRSAPSKENNSKQ